MMKSRSNSLAFAIVAVLLGVTVFLSSTAPAQAVEEADMTGVSVMTDGTIIPEAEAADTHAAAEGENLGFPQLNISTYASQVFWLFISFILLYALMSKIALPRIGEVVDMRQSQKTGNLGRAAEMSQAAEKIKGEYEAALAEAHDQARSLLAGAAEDISTRANAESSRFGEHARTRIATAEQTIARAKKDALASLSDISAEIAADMVNKIAGAQLTKAEAKKSVTVLMEKQ
jgi:F-type H+-transporting ATPase subunit b